LNGFRRIKHLAASIPFFYLEDLMVRDCTYHLKLIKKKGAKTFDSSSFPNGGSRAIGEKVKEIDF